MRALTTKSKMLRQLIASSFASCLFLCTNNSAEADHSPIGCMLSFLHEALPVLLHYEYGAVRCSAAKTTWHADDFTEQRNKNETEW